MTTRLPGLSVVLPCLNEAANIEQAVHAASRAARANAVDHQIVVVDDGSTDRTAEIAGALARTDPHIRLIVHDRNRGYGAAVASGIRGSTMPWILLTDADLQFDLDELEGFLPLADGADVVMGWRIARRDPLNRRVNAAAWNWLVRRTFGIPVRDVDCAFKLVRTDLVKGLNLQSTGAMISTELLVRSLRRGARLEQRGVNHLPRVAGDPSGASPRVVARAFRELLTLRRTLRVAGA